MRMERCEVVESASNLLLEVAARERCAERQVEHFFERSPGRRHAASAHVRSCRTTSVEPVTPRLSAGFVIQDTGPSLRWT
jgi:hypothetical protein